MSSRSQPRASTSTSTSSFKAERSIVGVENAQQRLRRLHNVSKLYSHGRTPARPRSRTELDVLKEHHKFIRSERNGNEPLSWEDQLAEKYYQSLFREYAVVDLKRYKSGAIALRWRTEEEVVEGKGNLTCGSLRCPYHQPSPILLNESYEQDQEDDERPLVSTRLYEQEMAFGYIEEGVKQTALVKVILCDKCAYKLKKGREQAKKDGEGKEVPKERIERDEHEDDSDRRRARRSSGQSHKRRRSRTEDGVESHDEEGFGPERPPDLQQSDRSRDRKEK